MSRPKPVQGMTRESARLLGDDEVEVLQAQAATSKKRPKTWLGGLNGAWTDPMNWENGDMPAPGDEVIIGKADQ